MDTSSTSSPSIPSRPLSPALARLRTSTVWWLAALALVILGLGVRFYDLTDQPLDFHPTRQLRGAIVARGMYYQLMPDADPVMRQRAIDFWYSTGQYEPSILEAVVARTYLLMGGENVWVSRIYTSLFWIIGGLAVFALARRMLAEGGAPPKTAFAAALLALAYMLILPFAVQASRAFQPDPGMVMWMALTAYALYRWSETPNWKWALLAGLLGGMAILTKAVAAYILGPAAAALVLYALGLKRGVRSPQVWSMALLMVLPTVFYYASREGRASEYFSSWTLALSHLLIEPGFYMRWLNVVQDLMGLSALLAALIGVLIATGRARSLLVGLWLGYLIYGLFLPYQMYTHSYYHEQLVPIIALSLAPVGEAVFARLLDQPRFWQALALGVALVGLVFTTWTSIYTQAQEDDRNQPAYWEEIAGHLPTDGKILALTQDYGYRLMYYGWRKVILWPSRGEIKLSILRGSEKEFEDYFTKRTEGKDYFLITAFNQLDDQPALQKELETHYPLAAEGQGYVIYDLDQRK